MVDQADSGTAPIPSFWEQKAAERTLRQAATSGLLPRALLLCGPDGVGKWAAAQWVARWLLCREHAGADPCGTCRDCQRVTLGTHPDLHLLYPVPSKSEEAQSVFLAAKRDDPFAVVRFDRRAYITIDRIRAVISELSKTSVEGGAKVVIIDSADKTGNDDHQSVLLKTIEEPPPNAYFILTSSSPERLLSTIISRCQMVRFVPVDPATIAKRLADGRGLDSEAAATVAHLCGGGWGNALRLATEEAKAWREVVGELWRGAFTAKTPALLSQIATTFPSGRSGVGFDAALQAFDVWGLCLLQDCGRIGARESQRTDGAPLPDLETGWACWRILQNGRGTLYVNVADRHAISGTFLALRRRLRCP